MYSSAEYALDICKCYTHYTKASINSTVKGLIDLRKHIPGLGDGWTFVDYFAGVGLGSIYLAQSLTAAGIDANVVYHNSSKNKTQVALAKRFAKEFGSPANLKLHLTADQPEADCYLFYEVFEHMREPWDFVQSLVKKNRPKCIVHASRFNLPNVSGHFKNYTIDGVVVSGKIATREFERKFASEGYMRTVIPQEFNGTPRVQLCKTLLPSDVILRGSRWDLKDLARKERLAALSVAA
jgi:2-polyprenyl-3-methyl-5-hydroxy-6-metoxy-1,4-benzoquinol methylase